MGIDLGKARAGISICDSLEVLASPLCVVYEWNRDKLLSKVIDLAKKEHAQMFVVGLPKNMDGTEGDSAQSALSFAEALREAYGKPVHMYDERCTTMIAHRYMNDVDVRGKKRKQTIDAAAAVIILQNYLDSKASGGNNSSAFKNL